MQRVEATAAHADLLAEMNRGLIVDQRSDNTMTLPKLAERMRGYFTQGWSICLSRGD